MAHIGAGSMGKNKQSSGFLRAQEQRRDSALRRSGEEL
jgi:hypothetical protein